MAQEFTLPDPGEGIHEAEIVELKVSPGDHVDDGDALVVVETDKAEVDVPSSFTGTVEDVKVSEGDDVRVGDVLLTYTTSDRESEEGSDEQPREAPDDDGGASTDASADDRGEDEGTDEQQQDASAKAGPSRDEAPDDEDDDADRKPRDSTPRDSDDHDTSRERGSSEPVAASPATRRLARELDVDLDRLEGSGPDGRVTDDDVRKAADEGAPADEETHDEHPTGEPRERQPRRPSKWPLTPRAPVLPDFERWGPVERIDLRSVRRATAQRMALAWSQVPHVMHEDLADITALERFRREQAESVESEGGKLTLTTLVVKAAVAALKEFPRFNASLDTEAGEIVVKRYFHIGVAVATDRGLLVPVIRDADRKSVIDIARELGRLADRARDGDLDLEEMRGGTFSITNPGGIGGTRFTPIVNFPQVAILGCGRAALQPVAEGDLDSATVGHRFRLPLCLGFDHRVNDGADAARFVRRLCELLADPESFTLTV
jgi:pyruvate dehydrogenase E2 component (dihydrolipoamide acetyltransferase)